MAKRNKLLKFAELLNFPHVYENFDPLIPILLGQGGKEVDLKGHWAAKHFENNQDIVLELACGRGEYSVGLAQHFPDRNFIGVDIKGARIWQGAKKALKQGLHNVAFLRTRIEVITNFFDKDEISEIWITFPDPFIRKSKFNRRLTSPNFLDHYRKILKPDGKIHLKTDAPSLYEHTLAVIDNDPACQLLYHNPDIYQSALFTPELELKTYYERKHLEVGKTIKYIQFTI